VRAPFRSILFFGLKSLTHKKKKNDEYTWTGGRRNFGFLHSTFLLFCLKKCKREKISFSENQNIFFPFHVRREDDKVGKTEIEDRHKKRKKKAALQRLRRRNNKNNRVCVCVCVCVYSSHLILINEKRRRGN